MNKRVQRAVQQAYINTKALGSNKTGGVFPYLSGNLHSAFKMDIIDEETLKIYFDLKQAKNKVPLMNYIEYIDRTHNPLSKNANARNDGWMRKVFAAFYQNLHKSIRR